VFDYCLTGETFDLMSPVQNMLPCL